MRTTSSPRGSCVLTIHSHIMMRMYIRRNGVVGLFTVLFSNGREPRGEVRDCSFVPLKELVNIPEGYVERRVRCDRTRRNDTKYITEQSLGLGIQVAGYC